MQTLWFGSLGEAIEWVRPFDQPYRKVEIQNFPNNGPRCWRVITLLALDMTDDRQVEFDSSHVRDLLLPTVCSVQGRNSGIISDLFVRNCDLLICLCNEGRGRDGSEITKVVATESEMANGTYHPLVRGRIIDAFDSLRASVKDAKHNSQRVDGAASR